MVEGKYALAARSCRDMSLVPPVEEIVGFVKNIDGIYYWILAIYPL